MIQLRLRERALLRQGQLFEPTASSGPAAMLLAISRNLSCIVYVRLCFPGIQLLAISRNLSCIPRRSPCPGRYPLPLASLFLSTLTDPSCIPRSPCPDRYPLPPGIPLQKKERHPTGSVLINITSRSPDVSGSYKTTHSPWP